MGNKIIKKKIREPATRNKVAGIFTPCSALPPQEDLPNSASGYLFLRCTNVQ